MPFLDFSDQLELLEGRVQTVGRTATGAALGDWRHVENSAAQREAALIPFGGCAVGRFPGVCGIVERASVYHCPIHEIAATIICVPVGIKYVDDLELADREHQSVRRLPASELIDIGIHFLGVRR